MSDYNKPLPGLDGLTEQFYAYCKQSALHFQRCSSCGTFRHVPREMCPECNSFDWEWEASTWNSWVPAVAEVAKTRAAAAAVSAENFRIGQVLLGMWPVPPAGWEQTPDC